MTRLVFLALLACAVTGCADVTAPVVPPCTGLAIHDGLVFAPAGVVQRGILRCRVSP